MKRISKKSLGKLFLRMGVLKQRGSIPAWAEKLQGRTCKAKDAISNVRDEQQAGFPAGTPYGRRMGMPGFEKRRIYF